MNLLREQFNCAGHLITMGRKRRIRKLCSEADTLFDHGHYSDSAAIYGTVADMVLEAMAKANSRQNLAKGAGIIAAVATGGIGLEDLIIIPLVNKMAMKMLGMSVPEACEILERVVTRQVECTVLSLDSINSHAADEFRSNSFMRNFLILYRLKSQPTDKELLQRFMEMVIPIANDPKLANLIRQISASEAGYEIASLARCSIPAISVLNAKLASILVAAKVSQGIVYETLLELGYLNQYTSTQNDRQGKNAEPSMSSSHEQYTYFCAILSLESPFTNEQLRNAYRSEMRRYHPDRVQHLGEEFRKLAEEKAKEINRAFEFLSAHTS